MRSQQEYVLRTVEERAVRFVQLWFTDVLGTAKTFAITPAELENALEEGMTFDGSAIDGFSRVQESDVLARPDPKTFQILPWHPDEAPVARVFCDIFNLDGSPFEGCPRHVLRRCLDRAREQGFTFFASPEIEYFYFANSDPSNPPVTLDTGSYFELTATDVASDLREQAFSFFASPEFKSFSSATSDPSNPPVTLDTGSYFELTATDVASDLRKRSVLTLEEMGIPVEHAQHEDAPSQHEIDLRYTDALTMADTVMTVRLVVKETAQRRGVHASFMPKPLTGVQGSGMHSHLSLFEGDKNAFYDGDDPIGLSEVAKRFTAGLLRHAHEITAVTNQWVNSYKRLVTGYEAPIHVAWARNNRSALVRVPVVKKNKHESTRIEYRAPDTSCNPYLAFAVILAAGLKGVEEGYDLPREAAANLFTMTPEELAADGIQP